MLLKEFYCDLNLQYTNNVLNKAHWPFLIQVTENSTVVYSEPTKLPATRLSFAEVVCPLDNDTFEHISNSPRRHDTFIARGYSISITNDGKHFGESDSIVIFNSSCVNCTKTGNQIECLKDVSLFFIVLKSLMTFRNCRRLGICKLREIFGVL